MAKLSISFETTTDEKKDMLAVLNFMMAINDVEKTEHPVAKQPYEAPVTPPVISDPVKEDKAPKIESKPIDEPKVTEAKEESVKDPVTTSTEKTPEQIKEEKNAKRREAYRKAKEQEGSKIGDKQAEPIVDTVTSEPEKVEKPEQTGPSPEVDEKAEKIDMQNKVRTLMAQKGEEGHRESILSFLRSNGIKGLNAMSLDQLHIVYDYLNTL